MKTINNKRTCPLCGQEYIEYPAISRKDNQTEICSLCGTREALQAMGLSINEQNEIIGLIQKEASYD